MKTTPTLLVRTAALSGTPAFVVACDNPALRWLGKSFRRLRDRKSFTLGDGLPIASDGLCSIEVMPGALETCTAINPPASGNFRWVLPPAQGARYADLVDAMADYAGACHQYLEAGQPDGPTVIATKEEYDLAALRQMRAASP